MSMGIPTVVSCPWASCLIVVPIEDELKMIAIRGIHKGSRTLGEGRGLAKLWTKVDRGKEGAFLQVASFSVWCQLERGGYLKVIL